MSDDLLSRLTKHRAIAGAPPEELAWLVARGTVLMLAPGDVLTPKTGPVRGLFIVLDGHLSISIDRGSGPQRVMEWRGGDVTGMLPYSRIVAPPGDVVAVEASEILEIDRSHLPALVRDCEGLTAIFVHIMVDRARVFTSSDLHNEKMSSLGRLAAGLAHELNNPASAVARSAEGLALKIVDVESASRALGAAALTPAQMAAVSGARTQCLAGTTTIARSALERADREERITSWLDVHQGDPTAADVLVESAITEDALNRLAQSLSGDQLRVALDMVIAEAAAQQLVGEIETAASRIYKLVAAVKGFTYMDQATAQKPVDIGQGLSDTLVILAPKARESHKQVTLDVPADLPHVLGLGGALNQVWANLVDNALDAAKSAVTVTAAPAGKSVVVRVMDDGPGVPAEIQKRIFDPFFTTKPPGQGTGLGLDTARRIVMQHRGEITVESVPGRTEFAVSLPIEN